MSKQTFMRISIALASALCLILLLTGYVNPHTYAIVRWAIAWQLGNIVFSYVLRRYPELN